MRSAIVGTGFMGQVHARAVAAAGGTVSAVVGRSPARAQDLAAQWGAQPASFDEALADADLIHICTPNDSHAELTVRALEAGRHVICEKPLATTSADSGELVRRAADAGAVTAVPFAYRFYPTVRTARRRAADAGRIRLIHGSYLQDWLSRPADDNWRVLPGVGGPSRAFADIGVHWCDLVEFVTGHRLVRVNALLLPGDRPTEDGATLMFETDLGAVGTAVISQVSPGRKNRLWFSVDAAEVSLQFDQEQPDSLWMGGRDETRIEARGTDAGPYDVVPVGHPQGYQDCFTLFVRDVHAAIAGQVPDGLPTFADGHRAAVLTEAVLRSAAARDWIEVVA